MRPPSAPRLPGALLLALLGLLLAGCGDAYDLPALAAVRPPTLRVLLGRRRTRARLRLPPRPWSIVSIEGKAFERRGRGALDMDVAPGPRGITLNGMATGATTLLVRPAGGFDLADTNYAGELRIHLRPGRVRFVNVVDLETYVAGVIPNEMAPGAGSAAYRAQAVAARTFAWIKIHEASAKARIFDVYDDQGSQVYTGRDPRYDVDAAAMVRYTASTAGVILTWKNQPFPAFYSSTCGGHTTDAKTSRLDPQGATGPLRGVRCGFCESSPRFRWKKTVSDAAVIQGMAARRRPIVAPVRAIEVTRKGPGGWAAQVRITYGPKAQTRTLPGTEFRSALRLDSHCVTSIRREGNAWVLEGRGWGHGVGMCQWGAMEMARRGFSESEILSWYYPGAAFVRVY